MGETSGFTQNPGVLQSLLDTEAFVGVEDNQLTDLQTDKFRLPVKTETSRENLIIPLVYLYVSQN